ncbi:FKBP2 [Cordylochernes scorpioides]|uniref:FKBP2 n=1 Tax=Cordylochernes scorpioides TaxID=51811 RepID=A0ABY6LUJ2_9ARAC|nr:FKBP2 [Cordylochernes scorpioides]
MNPAPQEARMGLRGLTTRKAYSSRPKKKVEGCEENVEAGKIKKLQIGIKKRIQNCNKKSKNGDLLHMHYKMIRLKSGNQDSFPLGGQNWSCSSCSVLVMCSSRFPFLLALGLDDTEEVSFI